MSGFFKEGLLLQVFQPTFYLLKVFLIHSAFHYPPQAVMPLLFQNSTSYWISVM